MPARNRNYSKPCTMNYDTIIQLFNGALFMMSFLKENENSVHALNFPTIMTILASKRKISSPGVAL